MSQTKIAINGFGRIGRIFFRQAFALPSEALAKEGAPQIKIVAINDLGSLENLAYLLKYDSVYGPYEKEVNYSADIGKLVIDGYKVAVLNEKDPAKLPWKDLDVDIVVESTGVFDSRDQAAAHLDAGAKRVIITAPAKDEITPVATPNINEESAKLDKITSNASCTTNAVNPVIAVMMANPGIKKAVLNTMHGYTASQGLVDGPDKKGDFRRARAAAQNIVPSTTGAAKATIRSIPWLEGKFDGLAVRVPVISGSLIDLTFVAARPTSVGEINNIFKEAAGRPEWRGVLTITEEPLVSTDILKNPHGSIIDLALKFLINSAVIRATSFLLTG